MNECSVTEANGTCKAECLNCHKELVGKNQVKYCSKRCELDYRIKISIEKRTRICIQCGLQFVMNQPSAKHNHGIVKEGQFCSRKCKGLWRRINDRRKMSSEVFFNTCVVCGTIFTSRTKKEWCSHGCQDNINKKKSCSRTYLFNVSKKQIIERVCKECNNLFAPEYGNKRRLFCSDGCLKKYMGRIHSLKDKGRAGRHGVEYEYTNPNKVFIRDGWACQICGKVTPKARRGSRYSNAPEIDHRIPISMGGPHLYSNIQCACRACNGKKSNKRTVGQLPLFGIS